MKLCWFSLIHTVPPVGKCPSGLWSPLVLVLVLDRSSRGSPFQSEASSVVWGSVGPSCVSSMWTAAGFSPAWRRRSFFLGHHGDKSIFTGVPAARVPAVPERLTWGGHFGSSSRDAAAAVRHDHWSVGPVGPSAPPYIGASLNQKFVLESNSCFFTQTEVEEIIKSLKGSD